MLSLPASVRVFVAVAPADLRKGFDGLAQITRETIAQDPLSGHFFVFANRRRDRVKILYWDRDGYEGSGVTRGKRCQFIFPLAGIGDRGEK
jgi:transposase